MFVIKSRLVSLEAVQASASNLKVAKSDYAWLSSQYSNRIIEKTKANVSVPELVIIFFSVPTAIVVAAHFTQIDDGDGNENNGPRRAQIQASIFDLRSPSPYTPTQFGYSPNHTGE